MNYTSFIPGHPLHQFTTENFKVYSHVKERIVSILVLIMTISIFSACEEEEQFASVTINGIGYVEVKTSHPLASANPPTITIYEIHNVAVYHTLLQPLTEGHPFYSFNFYISLEDKSELELNKPYNICDVKVSESYYFRDIIPELKDNLPVGCDGIAYYYKDGIIEEPLSLKGEWKLERCEKEKVFGYEELFYYGTYELINSSETDEPLVIKGNFKAFELLIDFF